MDIQQRIKEIRAEVYAWELDQRRAFRDFVLRGLGAHHPDFDNFLASEKSDFVRQVVAGTFQSHKPGMDDRPFMERAYVDGQKHTGLSGWELRFLIYYWVGRQQGKWD